MGPCCSMWLRSRTLDLSHMLTAVPVAPAVATAAYHATGKKVRDLSMTIKKTALKPRMQAKSVKA